MSLSAVADAPTLEIRPAELEEMEIIADFLRSSADWYRPFVEEQDMDQHDVDDSWGAENFEKRDFYLGHADEEPVGTVSLQYFGDYAYLGYVYLHADHVGQGFGRALLDFAQNKVRKQGLKGMILIAHPKATWAKRAYLKYGFEIIAKSKEDVLAWQNGALNGYYEEGFELYMFDFAKIDAR